MAFHHDLIARLIQWGASKMMKVPPELMLAGGELAAPQTMKIPTRYGEVRVEIYRPLKAVDNPPVYVNFHGGGYVVRGPEYDDHICRFLVAKVGCVVVNVDYDVAPQVRFPVPTTQAYDVCVWVAKNGDANGWDGTNMAVGGQSAGGGLAAAACLNALNIQSCLPNKSKIFKALIVNYAPLDISIAPEQKTALAKKPVVSPRMANLFDSVYAPNTADRLDPQVSPLRAETFKGFPPSLVVSAALDLLCAENNRLAQRMQDDGVNVTHHIAQNVDHGFTHFLPIEPVRETLELMAAHLNQNLNGKSNAV